MYKIQIFIIVICLYFTAYASLASDALNSIALYIAMPIAFFVSLFNRCNAEIRVIINKYTGVLLILFVWIFLSSLWAQYEEPASRELHRCLGSILLCLIFSINATNKKMIPWLYLTYLVLYLGAWNYAQSHIVIVDVTAAAANRLNDAKLNANTMAYYTFFVSFLIIIFGENFLKNSNAQKICRYIFFGLFPLSFFVALVTASRQVLVIQVPLLTYMLYHRYWKELSGFHRIMAAIILIFVVAAMSGFVESLYNNSYLAVRSEKNITEDTRFILIKEAIDVAFESFPLGVGAGNFQMYASGGHFSHNSYLELFANQGVIGLIMYIYLIYIFIKSQWSRFKVTKDNNYMIFFIFGLIFAFDNVFYVFYLDMWLIGFFILVATHSEIYSQGNKAYSIGNLNYEN